MSIKLEQHCIEISYTQCCPNTSETTLHKNVTCAIISLSTQTRFCRKITYAMLSWSVWANITQNNYLHDVDNIAPQSTVYSTFSRYCWDNAVQENYLCNVDPQSINNSAQKNNLEFCLDLSRSILHKETTCGMLAHD